MLDNLIDKIFMWLLGDHYDFIPKNKNGEQVWPSDWIEFDLE